MFCYLWAALDALAICRTAGTGLLPARQTHGLMSWSAHQSVAKSKRTICAAARTIPVWNIDITRGTTEVGDPLQGTQPYRQDKAMSQSGLIQLFGICSSRRVLHAACQEGVE